MKKFDRICAVVAYDVLPFWMLLTPLGTLLRKAAKRHLDRT